MDTDARGAGPHAAACGDRVIAYLDGELSAAECAALETHVATCSHCRRELELTRASLAAVYRAAAVLPRITPSPESEARLLARVGAELAARREALAAHLECRRWHARHWWAPALVVPLGLTALLAAALLLVSPLLVRLLPAPAGSMAAPALGLPPLLLSLVLSWKLAALLLVPLTFIPLGPASRGVLYDAWKVVGE